MTQITPSAGLPRRPAVTASAGAESLVGRVTAWAAHRPHATAVTHLDYDADPAGVPHRLSWAQLHRRAAALAIRIGQTAKPGDRVAVLAPTGVDYVVALLGAWYAHTVAVPLFTPELSGHSERLAGSF
jgi:fatty acid CoA ligase FadD32